MIKIFIAFVFTAIVFLNASGQVKDKAVFKEYKQGYYEKTILKDASVVVEKPVKVRPQRLVVDFSGMNFPTDTAKYKKVWHQTPVCQGNSGTCWCFATTSFMESEIKRITGKEIKLSEMYTVYWEYVGRAVDFVRTRGETYFAEGSEASAIPKIWKKYGIVPLEAYPGKSDNRLHHHHREMVQKMTDYLEGVKAAGIWNEEEVVGTIKSLLNETLGVPPVDFSFDGKIYTPKEFLESVCGLNMNDYYNFMSTSSARFYQRGELIEADNWWHCDKYYNIPVDDFLQLVKEAIKNGYSVSICGDISEPGYDSWEEVAVVPTFDVPAGYIDQDAREFRLKNGTTTDDHCIHIVGCFDADGVTWFMIKDSNGSSWDGSNKGYRFFREDYVKLKMMNIMLHKEAARKVLDKIIK